MAHFAQLNESNEVIRVVVVSNADLLDENGVEQEALGVAVCESVIGPGVWKQTSYNGKFRKKYAGIGDIYEPVVDVFYSPKGPYPSWSLDSNFDWQPPTPMPDDGNNYLWDEDSLTWVLVPVEEPTP